ncbi:MAG: HEAT repeat domain-containing protein [Ardenticatenaceae bacterium]
MKTIPEELLEQLEQGNVLLFIGERIVRDGAGEVAFEQLAPELVVRAGIADGEGISFPEIAQLYEDEKGLHELLLFVKSYFEGLGNRPQPVHRLIAGLTDCTVLATTCFDGRLERAFEEAGRPLNPIIGNVDVAFEEERKTQLYKLRGSLERIESLILTEDAYETFFEEHASISLVLQGYLARKTILFVGYDLTDPHFKRLYRKVTAPLDHFTRRAYAFGAALPAHIAGWAKRRQIEVIEADVRFFFESLTTQLADRKRPTPFDKLREPSAQPESEPLPERPYKFLDYYEAKDAGIFYGRQQETQHLCALIHAHRLVLLYGASGVGKTSLLLAGAVPRLERATPPYETIYIRALENPSVVIRRTLRRQLPDANLPDEGSLVDFLAAVTTELGQTLVIILDQFEEFFIRLSLQFRAAFISELGAVYDATDVPVKLVFSLREDWLASMDEIEERIPDLFRTRMRVSRLTETQAHQAITAPVERLGISYEPALLERLLADLLGSHQEVMPPQLQLICSALYDGRREEDPVLKVATYERLGGVQGVLGNYLEEELSRLEPAEQALARAILEELVTSEKTKAVKSSAELALGLEVKQEQESLKTVLKRLVRARLLRVVKDKTGENAYELAHEYLIHEISLTADTQARKQAEELIQQEVENWQRFGTVLAADKLALIGEVRDLLRLNDDAQALLLQSALQVGQDIEYWLNRIPEPTRRVELLTQATQSKLTIVRQRAAETLGTQDVPESVEPLLTLALHDRNMDVRDTASQSLAQLTKQHIAIVERLIRETENPTSSAAALRTLTYLPLTGLPLRLRTQVLMMRIRLRVTSLIQASVATPQRRAMAMTTGLFMLFVALAYIFSMNSYYVYRAPSDISNRDNTIVISQGHPRLPSMGLEKEMVDTGINVTQIKDNQTFDDIESKKWRGFWQEHDGEAYRKWGKQVSEVLKIEHAASMRWYLGEKEEAIEMLIEEITNPQDSQSRQKSVLALGQILGTHPKFITEHLDRLFDLLLDPDLSSSAADSLRPAFEANPDLAQPYLDRLFDLLSDPDLSSSAAISLAPVLKANPDLAQPYLDRLFDLLSEPNPNLSGPAAYSLASVLAANPDLAKQHIDRLFDLLSDPNPDLSSSAAYSLQPLLAAHPDLAQPYLDRLFDLLSNPDLSSSAAYSLQPVLAANPDLAQPYLDRLFDLLSDRNPKLSGPVASSLGPVLAANPDLAQQHIDRLFDLLSNPNPDLSHQAAYRLGQVLAANRKLAQRHIDRLFDLLSDPNPDLRDLAASSLKRVLAANLDLAQPHIDRFFDLLSDPILIGLAASSLGQVLAANPDLAQQHIDRLFDLFSDPNLSYTAASSLGQVLIANPQLAQPQHIEKLLALLSEESYIYYHLAIGLGKVLAINPSYAEEAIPLLQDQLKNSSTHFEAVLMLSYAYIHEEPHTLLEKLTDPRNTLERSVAAQALFLITLQEPSRDANIREELQKLSNSPEPMERIWANKTLAMLDIAAEVYQSCTNEKECERSASRLQQIHDLRNDSVNFFGEEFTWAAWQAFTWLEEQGNEE